MVNKLTFYRLQSQSIKLHQVAVCTRMNNQRLGTLVQTISVKMANVNLSKDQSQAISVCVPRDMRGNSARQKGKERRAGPGSPDRDPHLKSAEKKNIKIIILNPMAAGQSSHIKYPTVLVTNPVDQPRQKIKPSDLCVVMEESIRRLYRQSGDVAESVINGAELSF